VSGYVVCDAVLAVIPGRSNVIADALSFCPVFAGVFDGLAVCLFLSLDEHFSQTQERNAFYANNV